MHNAGSSAALGGRYYKEILLAAAEKLSAVKVFCQGGKQGRGSDRRHTFFTRRKHGQGPAGFIYFDLPPLWRVNVVCPHQGRAYGLGQIIESAE